MQFPKKTLAAALASALGCTCALAATTTYLKKDFTGAENTLEIQDGAADSAVLLTYGGGHKISFEIKNF